MNKAKKILSVAVCALLIGSMFAGCSSSSKVSVVDNSEIDKDTLLVAYYGDNDPFFTMGKDGKGAGFEADIMSKIFDSIKDDCKTYSYVKVDPDYKLGEDNAFIDKDGKGYKAYMAVGGIYKNNSTNNEDMSFTQPTITDRVITVTSANSSVKDYASFKNAAVATVSDFSANAMKENTAISSVCKSVTPYEDATKAFADLDEGKIDAVVIDELSYRTLKGTDKYTELAGQLDTIEYGFTTAKYDRLKDDINEAIYELESPKYNDKDEFTPIVKQYFGYDASSFEYTPVEG